jgi:hypothetical protein
MLQAVRFWEDSQMSNELIFAIVGPLIMLVAVLIVAGYAYISAVRSRPDKKPLP